MGRLAIISALLVGVAGVSLFSGCGNQGPVRHEITGKITFRKQPLDAGLIDFHPLDGQGSKSGDGISSNGEYRIPKDKGLFPGRYRVEIFGGDGAPTTGNAEPSIGKPGVIPGKERIPPKWNTKSDNIIEVKNGERNNFDFDIP